MRQCKRMSSVGTHRARTAALTGLLAHEKPLDVSKAGIDLLLYRVVVHFNIGQIEQLAVPVPGCNVPQGSVEQDSVYDALQYFANLVLFDVLHTHEYSLMQLPAVSGPGVIESVRDTISVRV